MPYCRKCGAELDEEAKFCSSCGTPVAPRVTEPVARGMVKERPPLATEVAKIAAIS